MMLGHPCHPYNIYVCVCVCIVTSAVVVNIGVASGMASRAFSLPISRQFFINWQRQRIEYYINWRAGVNN